MRKTPVVEFTVPGRPIPMPRPRLSGSRVFIPPSVTAYKDSIALIAKGTAWLDGDVGVRITFRMAGPRKSDIDNLIKSVLDALNGIVYKDDRQVVWLEASLFQDAEESTTITLYRIEQ